MLQAFAQKGGIFVDGEGSDTLEALLTDGAIQVSSGASYQWAKFSDSSYSNIAGATNKTLVINASSVESYASYRCTATYGGKTYQAYVSVLDKTDPLQVSIFSSLGDKILNGVGIGAVYATVYQNGTELDKVANITISETAPNSPVTNDLWAQIDSSLKKIIVKKYNGSTWDNHQFNDCSYKWTFLDYNGIAISDQVLTDQSTNKFVYIDGDIINKKIQFNIEVTKN